MDNNLFRKIPTNFDLNGPNLSFINHPVPVISGHTQSATFTGIATATFGHSAKNTGTIAYQWYDQNGRISNRTGVTGATTNILTLTNLISPTDHNRQFYVEADYVPSTSTGNAIIEPIYSNIAILSVRPQISIVTQPIGSIAIENTDAFISVVAASTDTSQGTFSYQWSLNGVDLVNDSTVSGSTTPNLTISRPIGIYTLQVKISNPSAVNSTIFSENVNIEFVPPRRLINTELYDITSSTAVLNSQDLLDGEITLVAQNQTSGSSLISLYTPQINLNIEMDIYSGIGNGGAQGGYSRIRFLMIRNDEYTIAGLDSFNNCPFIYRKGTLIAVCGKGGDSSSNGSGGTGGGINIPGTSGSGRGGGSGGALITAGTLLSNGIFGSSSTFTPVSPDTKATGQTGGRALPCPKGNYWISQGIPPCADVGTSKIFLGNGTLIGNSASIARGFKSGYDIRQTGGQGQNGVNPPPEYNQQTCTRRVQRTSTRRVQNTCYTRVPQTSTRTVPRTSTRRVPRTSTRRVQRTSYTDIVTVNPPPYVVQRTSYTERYLYTPPPVYFQQTSYTPVETIYPPAVRIQRTSQRTVERYDGGCSTWLMNYLNSALDLTTRNVNAYWYNTYCPSYVTEDYDDSYYEYPPSYTIGGEAYDSSYTTYPTPYYLGGFPYDDPYTVYPPSYTTGGTPYDSSYDETYDSSYDESYDTSYTETYDSSYNVPYDCSYDENYDDSYDENYDCSYYSYPPTPAAGGNGGAGATGGSGGTDSSGGGGGSGYTDGSVTVVSTQLGGSTGFSKIVIRLV